MQGPVKSSCRWCRAGASEATLHARYGLACHSAARTILQIYFSFCEFFVHIACIHWNFASWSAVFFCFLPFFFFLFFFFLYLISFFVAFFFFFFSCQQRATAQSLRCPSPVFSSTNATCYEAIVPCPCR